MKLLGCCLVLALATSGGFAQEDEPVYENGDGVSSPIAVRVVYASYTADAHKRRVEGKVVLRCIVGRDGVPRHIAVTRPLDDDLDQEAIRALTQWRFKPGTRDGTPVSVRIPVEMAFVLKR